jgi:hypothetical protein
MCVLRKALQFKFRGKRPARYWIYIKKRRMAVEIQQQRLKTSHQTLYMDLMHTMNGDTEVKSST